MTEQATLFDIKTSVCPHSGRRTYTTVLPSAIKPPCQFHSDMSRDAARRVEPKIGTYRWQVLEAFRVRGERGFTDNELIRHCVNELGMSSNTPRARRVELALERWIIGDGERDGSKVWMYNA